MSPLAKRDDEFLIPKPIIVLLIMIGSGFLICCGYAIHSAFGLGVADGIKPVSNEQQEYMAEVRVRNMDALAYEGAQARGQGHRRGEML